MLTARRKITIIVSFIVFLLGQLFGNVAVLYNINSRLIKVEVYIDTFKKQEPVPFLRDLIIDPKK